MVISCEASCQNYLKTEAYSVDSIPYKGTVVPQPTFACPTFKHKNTSSLAISYLGPIELQTSEFSKSYPQALQLINVHQDSSYDNISLHIKKLGNNFRPIEKLNAWQKEEYYNLDFSSSQITISTYTSKAVFIALSTLEYHLNDENGKNIALNSIEDWPDTPQRILQLNLKAMHPEAVKKVLHRAWRGHYNGILLYAHSSVKFKAMEPYVRKYAMPVSAYVDIVNYIRSMGMDVIPQFNLLSHQKSLFVNGRGTEALLYNEQTLNPEQEQIYPILNALIDEVDSLINPTAFHIGFDEVVGHNEKQIEKYGPMLEARLFIKHLLRVHNYLNKKNIQVWMWGDMFLNKDDFPKMQHGGLHANNAYAALIDQVPRDVVICDWHYKEYRIKAKRNYDYSSLNYFVQHGFSVYGCTYQEKDVINAFSRSAYQLQSNAVQGMIATTWHKLLNGTIDSPKSDHLKAFDDIASTSAEAFWNASKIKGPPFGDPKHKTN